MPPPSGSNILPPRDIEWRHSSDESSDSDSSTATRANTVEVTNLHPSMTGAQLLWHIMVAGSFGKVYSTNIKVVETSHGDRRAKALIAFFKKGSCVHFEEFVRVQGLVILGHPAKVSQSKEKAPENIEPQGRDDSRVLLFEGKNELLTPDTLLKMVAKRKVRESHIQMKELIWKTATTSKVAVAFTSYHDAYRMFKAVNKTHEPEDLHASYGRDPIASGVKTYIDESSGRAQLKAKVLSWE